MKRVRAEAVPVAALKAWDPAEKVLPEYSERQFKDLEEFVTSHGQIPAIVVSEEFQIVDGYNRWRLAKRLGLQEIECDVFAYKDETEMEIHAIVLNSKRRHLNGIQVARTAARLTELYEPPTEAEADVESADGGDVVHAETVQRAEPPPKQLPIAPIKPARKRKPVPAIKKASKELGVPQKKILEIKKVDDLQDRELIHAMEAKKVSISKAAELVDLPEPERKEVLAEALKEKPKQTGVSVMVNTCAFCAKKLQDNLAKLSLNDLISIEKDEISSAIKYLIAELNGIATQVDAASADESGEIVAQSDPTENVLVDVVPDVDLNSVEF